MATSRGERMQERMRGAGRHEVGDDSFGFVLPVEEDPDDVSSSEATPAPTPAPEPAPAAVPSSRSTPNTSAKRRRLNAQTEESDPAVAEPSADPKPTSPEPVASAQPSSASKNDPYDIGQDTSREEEPPVAQLSRHEEQEVENAEDSLESLPEAVARSASRSSVLSAGPHVTEEVTESPIGAPGSGHRRRVRASDVTTQSAQLQRMVMAQEASITEELTNSSPLTRKSLKSGVTPSALSGRSIRTAARSTLSKSAAGADADELSPLARPPRKSTSTAGSGSARSSLSATRRNTLSSVADEPDELSSPVPLVESRRRAQAAKSKAKRPRQPSVVVEDNEDQEEEDGAEDQAEEAEGAVEIDTREAAQRIVRKRPRPSPPREESPELDARPEKKSRKKRAKDSPARQSHPKPNRKEKGEDAQSRRRRSGGDEHIPVTVQRYTKPLHYNEDDTDADILAAEIPFANRGGVNVVDVLSQMCDEVIDSNLATLHNATVNAKDAATKKEYRTKLRALEAFQEELRTRLLEHTIALDTLHALKKRVRSIQKEKLGLRNDIVRIRAEREQVALKMDAVRIQHETESKQSLDQLNLSSTMHDIDLAVENGRQASELNPKEQRTAELANLELLISRVADQASATGGGSGNLKQIQEFNAFLERAAVALEAR
ncbi:hypothetical protein JX265_011294 [Neoarthrinium moseri]|uniref:Inner kinetochore subunit AME1 domain-containing protein n=1 Tax=Neoarthrinium moseri TaxID=1658444 RepID=A0A9P9WCT9_9PEZI|nr:hypothetical protein JX265_011294 [Neoarthrinium moseri]